MSPKSGYNARDFNQHAGKVFETGDELTTYRVTPDGKLARRGALDGEKEGTEYEVELLAGVHLTQTKNFLANLGKAVKNPDSKIQNKAQYVRSEITRYIEENGENPREELSLLALLNEKGAAERNGKPVIVSSRITEITESDRKE